MGGAHSLIKVSFESNLEENNGIKEKRGRQSIQLAREAQGQDLVR